MKTATSDRILLADAVAELIETLHQKYPGIKTKPVPPVEDEDFTLEVDVPKTFSIEEVEKGCHSECIRLEDKYDIYILPLVTRKAA
ncbi:MAG: hypothetical protein HY034_03960 [Nitrospirae bacterium]|nr:hypothetical protein [Nitrospirota bacterium]